MVKEEKNYGNSFDLRRSEKYLENLEKRIEYLEGRKADESSIIHVKELAEEAKKIAISARDKAVLPHECQQLNMLEEIRYELRAWRATKLYGLVGLVVAIVGAVVFMVNLGASVTVLENNISDVKMSIQDISKKSESLHRAVTAQSEDKKGSDEQQVALIQQKIDQAIRRIVENGKSDTASKSR